MKNISKIFFILGLTILFNTTLFSQRNRNPTPYPPIGFVKVPSLKLENNYVIPEINETQHFQILRKLYLINDTKKNWLFQEKLLLTIEPAVGIVKYFPENSIKGKIEFYNDQIWMHVFDKEITKFMLVFVDDGFDGYLYYGNDNDNLIDRIGILTPLNKLEWVEFRVNPKTKLIYFQLPPNNREFVFGGANMSYEKYWQIGIKNLNRENNPFVPIPGSRDVLSGN